MNAILNVNWHLRIRAPHTYWQHTKNEWDIRMKNDENEYGRNTENIFSPNITFHNIFLVFRSHILFFVLPCLSFLLCSGETCLDFLIHKNEICNAHYYKQATALPCALIWNMVIQLWRKETREKKHRNFHTNAARFSNVMYYCYFYCCCCYYWCCCCRWYRVV